MNTHQCPATETEDERCQRIMVETMEFMARRKAEEQERK